MGVRKALNGPSLMPGGTTSSYEYLEPILKNCRPGGRLLLTLALVAPVTT